MARREHPFKGRQFTADVILWAVRWYLQFPISYRDLELMLRDRGVSVDPTTISRWIQAYAPELETRRRHLRPTTGSWRVDETYLQVKRPRVGLDPAVDRRGATAARPPPGGGARRPIGGSRAGGWPCPGRWPAAARPSTSGSAPGAPPQPPRACFARRWPGRTRLPRAPSRSTRTPPIPRR